MAFATVSDFATFIGRDLTAADTATASQALDLATGYIQARTGQTISSATETVTLDGIGYGLLALPEIPVTAVASVVVEGLTWVNDTDYYWTRKGIIRQRRRWWGYRPRSVVVTYTHGYSTIPEDIRRLCLKLAQTMYENPGNVKSESIGDYSVAYGAVESNLNEDDKATLAYYSIPQVA